MFDPCPAIQAVASNRCQSRYRRLGPVEVARHQQATQAHFRPARSRSAHALAEDKDAA
jgi:hypothetical protein